MTTLQAIPGKRCGEIIEHSIRNEVHAVLSHNRPEGWRTYKANFVSGSRASRSLRIKAVSVPPSPDSALPDAGEPVGVSFRLSHKKCMFSSVVQSTRRDEDGILFTLSWPDKLQQLRRRAYERVAPPQGTVIPVRFWRDTTRATGPQAERQVRHGQLEDISAGGMRIKAANLSDLEVGGSYHCAFMPRPSAPALVLEATLCHHEATDQGRASLGFRFVGLEATPDGQRMLERLVRIVSQYQHEQSRRAIPPVLRNRKV